MREEIDIKDYITFGCEVEFKSSFSLSKIEDETDKRKIPFKIEYDNILGNIKEAISPIMTSKDLHYLKEMLELLKFYNSRITKTQGAHIHFGHQIVKDEYFINMLKLWCITENIIYKFSCGEFDKIRPHHNIYAERLEPNLSSMIREYEKKKTENFDQFKFFRKTYGFNLYNHLDNNKKKDTYEVRVPNGTLNYEIWLNNIDFFGNLLNYANSKDSVELINYYFKKGVSLKPNELSEIIFNNNESKEYFVKQYKGYYSK